MIHSRRMILPFYDGLRTSMILTILIIAAFGVVFGLNSIVEDQEIGRLLFVSIFAILAGWVVAGIKVSGWIGVPLLTLTGAVLLIVDLSFSTGRLLHLLLSGMGACLETLRNPVVIPTNFSQELPDLLKFITDTSAVVFRVDQWFKTILKGVPSYDKLAMDLVWGTIIWLVFIWCSWAMRRRFQTLGALLPMYILLAGTLGYVRKEPVGLIILLGATLVLTIAAEQIYREQVWLRKGTDFSYEIRIDLTLASIPVLVALILLSAIAPTISIKQIADNVRQFMEQTSNQGTAFTQSLGLREPTREENVFSAKISPGMPRQHLLGSGPDLSRRIVMVIKTNELPPLPPAYFRNQAPIHYWRGLTYDHYTGHGWTSLTGNINAYEANQPALAPTPPNRSILNQQVKLVENVGEILYAAGEVITVDQPFQIFWRSGGDSFGASTQAVTYKVTSSIATLDPDKLRQTGYNYPDWVRRLYLTLPNDLPAEVRVLARSLTAGARTPYDQARAIETYLRTYPYSLDIPAPPMDQDVVDYFLFRLKKGYCDYFATAMVVLARAAGIPARMAVGYASGAYDALNASYIVTEADAHSWPEIYFPAYGWVEFEPTTSRPLPGGGPAARSEFNGTYPAPGIVPSQQPGGQGAALTIWGIQIPVFWVVIAFILILFALRIWLPRLNRRHLLPLAAMSRIYQDLQQQGQVFNISSKPGDTAFEFGRAFMLYLKREPFPNRLSGLVTAIDEEMAALLNLYVRSLYSPRPVTETDVIYARKIWGHLRLHLWQSWLLRLFGPHRVYNEIEAAPEGE